jgi:hypothetical protein
MMTKKKVFDQLPEDSAATFSLMTLFQMTLSIRTCSLMTLCKMKLCRTAKRSDIVKRVVSLTWEPML